MIGSRKHPARRCGAGYSLGELVVALGILAVALPLVATAFLAGALENAESIQNTLGTLVAENALAVVRARVTNADLMRPRAQGGFGTEEMDQPERIPDSLVDLVDLEWDPDRHENLSDPHKSGMYGCVVMAQRLAADRNDYRLIAIPFRKFQDNNMLDKMEIEVDSKGMLDPDKLKVLLSDPDGDDPIESADIGFLVVRTALRP